MRTAVVFVCAFASTCLAAAAPASLEQKVDAFLRPYVATNNFSGSVLIARDGRVLVKKSYGLANQELGVVNTPATKFQLASLSKAFTATAVLVLEQQGRLRVEDLVARHLPDYPRGNEITIHHLLAHRSGIANVNQLPGWDEKSRLPHTPPELVALFRDVPLAFVPGSKFQYANSNYILLAMIIETISGTTYADFLQKNVFAPAGMNDSGHRGTETAVIRWRASGYTPTGVDALENARYLDWSNNVGAGSLYSTVEDLYRFDRALRQDKILVRASQQKMVQDYGSEVGYGWFLAERSGRHFASLAGRSPGFNSFMERSLGDDIVLIALSNNYSSIGQNLGRQLLPLLLGEPVDDPLARFTGRRGVLAEPVLGQYQFGDDFAYNPGLVVRLEQIDAGIILRSEKGGDSFLLPIGDLQFIDRTYGGIVTVVPGQKPVLRWKFGKEFEAKKRP